MSNESVILEFPRRGRAKMAYLLERYHQAHPDEDPAQVEPHLVAEWAIKNRVYHREPQDPRELLRRELSRYLKNEYVIDPQGREVRKHHAVIKEVRTAEGIQRRSLWFEIFDAPAEHMQAALALRRRGALRDVLQMDLDFESWNANNRYGEKLAPLDYNFNPDAAEAKLPTTYPEAPPDDDFDDEDF